LPLSAGDRRACDGDLTLPRSSDVGVIVTSIASPGRNRAQEFHALDRGQLPTALFERPCDEPQQNGRRNDRITGKVPSQRGVRSTTWAVDASADMLLDAFP
jgi:hypothetical protein